MGFKKFYTKFLDYYGREGYIDSNYNTPNLETEENMYASPIKSASIIKLKNPMKGRSLFDIDKEPQAKSPDHIPKSEVLDYQKLSNTVETSEVLTNKIFREPQPSPRIPLKSVIQYVESIRKTDLLSKEISYNAKDDQENKVVVFDQTQMKQFLLGVWDQMNKHLGAIDCLKEKLTEINDVDLGSNFKKKNLKKNEYGVPIYEEVKTKNKKKYQFNRKQLVNSIL